MESVLGRVAGAVLAASLTLGCSQDGKLEGSTSSLAQTSRESGAEIPATQTALGDNARIILLHHSTGQCIWDGGLKACLDAYNDAAGVKYTIEEREFPKNEPYGWNNYPYDYWNIWVRHAGPKPYQTEPTLEILTADYDVIVFKHCFPVSNIEPDTGAGDISSEEKRIENYQLQYAALKEKLRSFPRTRFIVWTGAAQVRGDTDEAQARRAKAFFDWVKQTWDAPGDNIYVWDFRALETEGGLYLKPAYSSGDAHPNEPFSAKAAPLLAERIVDVIRGAGDSGDVTGKSSRSITRATVRPQTAEAAPAAESVVEPPRAGAQADGAPSITPPERGAFLFDNAEEPGRKQLWPAAATYADAAGGRVVKIDFSKGKAEDWGEYGPQRIIMTSPPPNDWDISRYRYLAFRVRADRDAPFSLTLVTDGDRTDESHFGFTAYLQATAGPWRWVVLDLAKLELAAEGERAYAAAGKPPRPMSLTTLKLVTHENNAKTVFEFDDITFHHTLPPQLADKVQAP